MCDLAENCQVEGVLYRTLSFHTRGTLHITAHHLIFKYNVAAEEGDSESELWVLLCHTVNALQSLIYLIRFHILIYPS